jgi:hypothetical protein
LRLRDNGFYPALVDWKDKVKAEQQVQSAILEWLAAKRIWAIRMQTGAIKLDKRFIKFGVAGCADILAFYPVYDGRGFLPIWIEVKSNVGRQSELQRSFELDVIQRGHRYLLAKSVDDVEKFFKEL